MSANSQRTQHNPETDSLDYIVIGVERGVQRGILHTLWGWRYTAAKFLHEWLSYVNFCVLNRQTKRKLQPQQSVDEFNISASMKMDEV